METAAKADAAPPPSGDQARGSAREQHTDRIVMVTASTDPHRALADIAQQRAKSMRRGSWKRASQTLLVLGVLAAALMIPRFREHSLAAAPVSSTAPAAAQSSSALPAAPSPPIASADTEQVVAPVPAIPEDPSTQCESHFKARMWRAAIEDCSAAFDATPSPALAMRVAHAHWAHGDAASAGSWARNALELESKDPDAYVLIGNAEHAAGKRPKAVAAYRHYLELAPRGWHAARLRAFVDDAKNPAGAPKK
jgi:hypothetical protein